MIRLLIADDHEVVRHGLKLMFGASDDFQVLGEASRADEVVSAVQRLRPDVVLLDLRMPGPRSADVVREVKRRPDAPRVLVLTGIDDQRDVLEAVQAGADGYALKQISAARLQDAVRAIASGQSYLDPGVASGVMSAARERTSGRRANPWNLSRRELEVLEQMGASLSNDEIARRLFISEETVRTHVKSILKKTGRRHRMEAVLAAIAAGVIDLAEPAGITR